MQTKFLSGGSATFLLFFAAMPDDTPPVTPLLRGPVPLSHLIIRHFTREGDHVVDATCGNGNDTLLLAELVGASGRVWAFDIQSEAIGRTMRGIAEAGLAGRVEMIHAGHESLTEHVPGTVSLVVFNLGYLPGGNRSIITRPETTGTAIEQSLAILRPGGIVALTVYPAHNGGACERLSVEELAARLDPRCFHSWRMGQLNATPQAPSLILIQKAA
jgi:predicted methyltransferase